MALKAIIIQQCFFWNSKKKYKPHFHSQSVAMLTD